jgi:hypothetical protein
MLVSHRAQITSASNHARCRKGDTIQGEGIHTESAALHGLEQRLHILRVRVLLVRGFEQRRELRDGVVRSRRTRTMHRFGRNHVREVRGKMSRDVVVSERPGPISLVLFREPRLELGHVLDVCLVALSNVALHQRHSFADIQWGRLCRHQRLPGELTEDLFQDVDARREDSGLWRRGRGTGRARKSGSDC